VINYTSTSRIAVFFVNFVAIVPSSRILGLAIDELEAHLEESSVLMGLISCTFGCVLVHADSVSVKPVLIRPEMPSS
jgi:hypothetical protein